MIVNLRDSKARLSELVELASTGEDVLITVRGRLKARLTQIAPTDTAGRQEWLAGLLQVRQRYSTGNESQSVEGILSDIREERTF